MSVRTFEAKMAEISKRLAELSPEDFQFALDDAIATEIENQPGANFLECRACGWDTDAMDTVRCIKCGSHSFVALSDDSTWGSGGSD